MESQRFIAVKEKRTDISDAAFVNLMELTESNLNEWAKLDRLYFKKIDSSEMEKVAETTLKEIAPSVQFNPKNIKLISGARFPDITAEKFYGVEVKTTKENKWTSTGSSIIESTRIEDVETIYMLFAKFGGDPAEFRCKPYEECLSDIGVTHSPRYHIDMDLDSKVKKTIFQKIGVPYEDFYKMEDNDKIRSIKNFYIENAKKKGKAEMPWWIGDNAISMTIKFFNEQSLKDKRILRARMFILFSEMFDNDYRRACLWLCSKYSLLCYNIRDLFSAGGKIDKLGKKVLKNKVPRIIKNLYDSLDDVKTLLMHPDNRLLDDIIEYWGYTPDFDKLYEVWEERTKKKIISNHDYDELSLSDVFDK